MSSHYLRTKIGTKTIQRIKKDILKRKIMLGFIINSYSWWDKAYRWGHIAVATMAPLAGVINITVDSTEAIKTISLVINCIVVGMVKFKDYINFSEIRDTAKSQTIKYSQLFERIERELIKPDAKKQPEDEFIYWINREFTHIELNDPELSPGENDKFLKMCQKQGIVYDNDLDLLQKMINQDKSMSEMQTIKAEPIGTTDKSEIAEPIRTIDKSEIAEPMRTIDKRENAKPIRTIDKRENVDHVINIENDQESNSDTDSDRFSQPTLHRILSLAPEARPDAETFDNERDAYKKSLKKLEMGADMQWITDRLQDLG